MASTACAKSRQLQFVQADDGRGGSTSNPKSGAAGWGCYLGFEFGFRLNPNPSRLRVRRWRWSPSLMMMITSQPVTE